MDIDAYFLCGTPRTGSTLLCSLLKSAGVAGYPESYFRRQDETKWAQRWNVISSPTDKFTFEKYLEACLSSARTENGLFAARIMWGTMEELVTNLAALFPYITGKDIDFLSHAFGHSRFIYLKREDFVAQAVSRLRAEQTNIWHVTEDAKTELPSRQPKYDFDRIRQFVKEAEEHNTAWIKWFNKNGITPYTLNYENFSGNPVLETTKVIDFLGLSLPENIKLSANNKRMADEVSKAWIERFRSEISA